MRKEEGISHRGNPDLPVGIFYHRFYMRIVHQHIHTAHILLLHIHEIKTIPHRTQPQIAIRILSYKGWVHIAIMRHSRHLQLLQFTGLGREDCKMHTCHKQQDITIAEPYHLRIIRIMGTGNPEGIRLQIIKPETQEIPITATHIEMTVYRQAVTQHRTNHRRLMEHLNTLVTDTATQHLMIAHQPGMLVIIFHHVAEIDFPRGRKRIEDGSQGSVTNLLSLLIIDKDTEGCTCQDMFSHSRQGEYCDSLRFFSQKIIVGFLVGYTVLGNNLDTGVAITHPEITTQVLESSTHHLYRLAQDRMVFRKWSFQIIGFYASSRRGYLLISADMKSLIAITYQYRQRVVFFRTILYGYNVIILTGNRDTMEVITTHVSCQSILSAHPHSAFPVQMKHIDIVIGERSSILDVIAELYIVLAVVNIHTSRCTNPHQLSSISCNRRNALR